jgi:cytochrome c biogenesis protein CcdA
MKSRSQQWDLVIGAFASLIALAGILLSISLGNIASIGFGIVHRETQQFLAVIAGMFVILVAIKVALRYRCEHQIRCGRTIDRLLQGRRDHPRR